MAGKLFYKLNRLSIKTKFAIIFLFASLIPILLLGIFSYNSSVKSLEEEYTGADVISLSRVSAYIDNIIQQIYDLSEALSRDEHLKEIGLKAKLDKIDITNSRQEILAVSKLMGAPARILVLMENNNFLCNFIYSNTDSSNEMTEIIKKIKSDGWYQEINRYNKSTHFIGVFKDKYFGEADFYHYYFSKNLYDADGHYIGQILLDVNAYIFDRILGSLNKKASSVYYMVDEQMKVLAISDEKIKNRDDIDLSGFKSNIANSKNSFDAANGRQRITFFGLNYSNWMVMGSINKQDIRKTAKGISFFTIILFVVLLLFEIFIYFLINKTITTPILKLSREMEKAEKGCFDIYVQTKSQDEVGILTVGFNNMVAQIKKLFEELIQEQKLTREFEFAMLQAQINPHFLCNSLNGIKHMAEINNSRNISSAISSLINLLRYVISDRNELISLNKEKQYIDSYIHLNNIRYNNKFRFISNIPLHFMEYKILKFTLQPLVENSVLHGFKSRNRVGTIELAYEEQPDCFIIKVIDNGEGMTQEQITEAFKENPGNNSANGFTHIGLWSVDRRIRLIYGDKYGISIESRILAGTTILIRLPLQIRSGDDDG